jgi:hypothetical protein
MAAAGQVAYEGLPKDAFIVEVKTLPKNAHRDRALVLWMLHPRKQQPLADLHVYTCPEMTLGKGYFTGPTRVSLVDTAVAKVLNTIKLTSAYDDKDEFDVPYRIAPEYYYHVSGPLHNGEGKPDLLHLRDYNGDGEALEAAFFVAGACQGLLTTLIGYSKHQDKVMQYWIELVENGEKEFERWVDYLFSEKPQRPGYWKYEIDYRGRGGNLNQYEVRYDPALERFYGTLKSVPSHDR